MDKIRSRTDLFHELKIVAPVILPPIFPKKIEANFNSQAGMTRINQLKINQSPLLPEQGHKRTQSLYSLPKNISPPPKRTRASPSNKNQYNKWYVPPDKRFVDLQAESPEHKSEVKSKTELVLQQQQIQAILFQSKHIRQYVQEFQASHNRSPLFIH